MEVVREMAWRRSNTLNEKYKKNNKQNKERTQSNGEEAKA